MPSELRRLDTLQSLLTIPAASSTLYTLDYSIAQVHARHAWHGRAVPPVPRPTHGTTHAHSRPRAPHTPHARRTHTSQATLTCADHAHVTDQ